MGCKCSKSTDVLEQNPIGLSDSIASDLIRHYFVDDINTIFEFHEVLGKGAFGYVTRATNIKSGKQWAVKVVDLQNTTDKQALRNEIDILKRLQHPHIVKVTSSYEDKEKLYMVMQLCTGREMFDHLYRDKKIFTEDEVRDHVRSLLLAISYMHRHHVTHRDLKLENLLLESDSESATLKVCDFGFSKFLKEGERMNKTLGTLDYLAPEVLVGDYTEKCDVWSIGVICYELLSGRSPFRDDTRDGTLAKILDARLTFEEARWKRTSEHCIRFINCLVKEDPDERWSAEKALRHPWMTMNSDGSNRGTSPLSIDSVVLNESDTESENAKEIQPERSVLFENVIKFGKSRKFKQMAMLSVALGIDPNEIEKHSLSNLFCKWDENNEGTINRQEFNKVMVEHGGLTLTEAEELFAHVDQTESDSINYLEFLAATLNSKTLDEGTLREAFAVLDVNNTGRISVSGLQQLFKRRYSFSELQEMIESADITGDGVLNFDEFKILFHDTPTNHRNQFDVKNSESVDTTPSSSRDSTGLSIESEVNNLQDKNSSSMDVFETSEHQVNTMKVVKIH